jgi:hypothetical protein
MTCPFGCVVQTLAFHKQRKLSTNACEAGATDRSSAREGSRGNEALLVVTGAAATFPPPPVIFCQVEVGHI